MKTIEVRRLGLMPYAQALELQRALVDDRKAGRVADTLLLLQHPHVLTIGVKKDGRQHILATPDRLAALGVEVFEAGRGGDVTYHGPGQLVGYPIIDLNPDRRDVHRYVRDLEEVMIRVCADFGIEAGRIKGLSGTWVDPSTRGARSGQDPSTRGARSGQDPSTRGARSGQDPSTRTARPGSAAPELTRAAEKIGAIGVRISRWVTSHGFAFNVTTDTDFFKLIVPCGITDRGVTSLGALLGRPPQMAEVEDRLVRHFGDVFERSEL